MKKKHWKYVIANLLLKRGNSFLETNRILRDLFGTGVSNNALHTYYNHPPSNIDYIHEISGFIDQLQLQIDDQTLYIKKLRMLRQNLVFK